MATMKEFKKFSLSYVSEDKSTPQPVICRPSDIKEYIQDKISDSPIEQVLIFALDTGCRVIGYTSFEGASNFCFIHPQQVFTFLLSVGAAGFIMAHNHPGGTQKFSDADIKLTAKVYKAGKILDVVIQDHILIHDDKIESMRDSYVWDTLKNQ